MLDVKAPPSVIFPDDPLKWDGWSNYKAANLYDRLCLDRRVRPTDEQIEEHCTVLLKWWRKKLPLKNQPSNPMAQLLGRGLDEAARYLVEARMQLLDPALRRQLDDDLAAQAQQETVAEFSRFVAFSVAGKVLTADAEAILVEFGQSHGLTEEQARTCIEEELQRKKARRAAPPPPPAPVSGPKTRAECEMEFSRIVQLANLDLSDATPRVRRIFATLGENLGIPLERAEHLLDEYLDAEAYGPAKQAVAPPTPLRAIRPAPVAAAPVPAAKPLEPAPQAQPSFPKPIPADLPPMFNNPVGAPMKLIPAGEFIMGSDAPDAAADEQPLTPVTLTDFYMGHYPVTNAEYEKFDPRHRQKRIKGAGDDHPVVYVTSLEATKYCEWLRQKDGRNYRLPTEAEWEYAARGGDGRIYPWGNNGRRGDLANFADASTTFAWRDPLIADGYPETAPVGAFPRGRSFFGLDDMAGNVWEWCLDFYQPLSGSPKRNPRGLVSGSKRLYRGGSWKSRWPNLRATARGSNAANYSCNDVGFRLVCEVGGSELV